MTQKLNQVIAIEKGIKQRNNDVGSELYKAAQKPVLFNGFAKKYKPLKEDGEQFPAEAAKVQMTVKQLLKDNSKVLAELLDVTATKDFANCAAKANVVVDGKVLVEQAPATYLLFLEKQLIDLHTLALTLPVLDSAEDWTLDPNADLYKTNVTQTSKTKKVQKSLVLIAPTVAHPGQAVLITEDEMVGNWDTVKLSGAMPKPDKEKLVEKIEKLQKAVKQAREEANVSPAIDVKVADKLLAYLL
jgi:hypothetical protein